MKRLVSVCVFALAGMICAEGWAQARGGGRGNCAPRMPATASAGGAAALTDPTLLGSRATSAARLRRQAQILQMQQAYLLQAQAYLARQQAVAAKKAEQKQRQIANRKLRREAELARKNGTAARASPRSRDDEFAAMAK